MKLTILQGKTDAIGETCDLDWPALVSLLGRFRHGAKDGLAWCPVEFNPPRRKKENVARVECAVLDLDDFADANEFASAVDRIRARGWECVVHSTASHSAIKPKARVVFRLDRPVMSGEWPSFRSTLAELFQLKPDENAKDASRLFYLPTHAEDGSPALYIPLGGIPVPVDAVLTAAAARVTQAKAEDPSKLAFTTPARSPSLSNAEGQYNIDAMLTSCRSDIKKLLTQSEPWANVGGRDASILMIAKYIGNRWSEAPTEVLLELMRPGLSRLAPPETGTWFEIAAAKLEAGKEFGLANRAHRAAIVDDWRSHFAQESMASARKHAPEAVDNELPDGDPTKVTEYSREEISRWAAEQGCDTLEKFKHRWIIQRGASYFVFVEGRYYSPITLQDLPASLPRDLARVPGLMLTHETKEGVVPCSPEEIMRQCRTGARVLMGSLSLQKSYYDPTEQTFHEAMTPLRNIYPKFHEEIQTWLETLGGPRADRLLDWVAAVTRLDRQSAALYLEGPPNAGKGLMAAGLARLWSTGGPSKLGSVLSGFNEALTRCPLLVADEKLPEQEGMTATLREMIGESARQLNRKFLSTSTVTGAVRLLILGNNDHLLETAEDLSAADRLAVSQRFLYILAPKAATDYLEKLGQPVCNSWIESDKLAEHALWLRDNRKLDEQARFLVTGDLMEFHDRLAVNSGLANLVSQWLVMYLSDRTTEGQRNPEIEIGKGFYFVTTKAMASESAWTARCPGPRVPPMSKLGDTLRALSRGAMEYEGRNYFNIEPNLLLTWARRAGVGNLEYMKKRINDGI